MEQGLLQLWASTGLYNFTFGQVIMIVVGGLLIFLAIKKGFEPLLLIPSALAGFWPTFRSRKFRVLKACSAFFTTPELKPAYSRC